MDSTHQELPISVKTCLSRQKWRAPYQPTSFLYNIHFCLLQKTYSFPDHLKIGFWNRFSPARNRTQVPMGDNFH
ncbi:hypothetical protein OUZ56_025279 [Daphnia magna]|uniref:Uncharacterized protein n=1 Tax=Daphnia magna TaxID=35525 RepID=A0ABQ9ZJD4_9CRUS|nr:hypothetical protein OUZ56_025279 [Daphnia magna]